MSIFQRSVSANNMIEITDNGIQVASFPEIRDYYVNLWKQLYGVDIDVSNVSADGQYANEIALITSNVLQLSKYAHSMLDPQTARGKYLDILCSFSNILRKSATQSIASVYVKNISGNDITVGSEPIEIVAIDRNNNRWIGELKVNLAANEYTAISFVCEDYGPIQSFGTGAETPDWESENNGSIYQTVDYGRFQLYQCENGILGSNDESDESLRMRLNQNSSTQSVSVLSGLQGALLNANGIKDAWIFNGTISPSRTMDDTTVVPLHNIYVCLRYEKGMVENDEEIGNIIYNKLTPGILTTEYGGSDDGEGKTFAITKYEGIPEFNIYWKKCIPVTLYATSPITIKFVTNPSLYVNTISEPAIKANLVKYINSIKLGDSLNTSNLITVVQQSDKLKNNLPTYYVTEAKIKDYDGQDTSVLQLKNSYLEISENEITFSYSGNECTITIQQLED